MKKLLILLILPGMLFFFGCDSLDGACRKNPFGLSAKNISVDKNGGIATVTAKSGWWEVITDIKDSEFVCLDCSFPESYTDHEVNHRIKVIGEWFEVVEDSKQNLTITVDENNTGAVRSLSLSVEIGNCSSRITLTQRAR